MARGLNRREGCFIGFDDAGFGAEFSSHVRQYDAFRHRHGGNRVPTVLDHTKRVVDT